MFSLFEYIQEATASDIQRKQKSITKLFPPFPDRVKAIGDKGGVRLRDTDAENWYFNVHSGTKEAWYEDIIHFKDIVSTLENLVKNRRLWVRDRSRIDFTKLAHEFLKKTHIKMSCSCPASLYWGPDYILGLDKYDAKYGRQEPRAPKIRNPKQYGSMCKHMHAVMKVLPFYTATVARWLQDFYKDDIRKFEEEAKAEFGWIQKAAVKLGKKKKEEEEKPEETPEEISKEQAKKAAEELAKRREEVGGEGMGDVFPG